MITKLLIVISAFVLGIIITSCLIVFISYIENRQDELLVESLWSRYVDYIKNKGKELAERRNRRVKK